MFIVNVEGAVHRGDGRWLLIRRSAKEEHAGGTLSLVGGKADPEDGGQELLERTLRRELLEEVGIEVKNDLIFLYSTSFVTDRGQHAVNAVFLCEHADGEAHVASPDEVEAVYWLTAAEVEAHPDAPTWTKESIRRAEAERLRREPKKRFKLQRRQLAIGWLVFTLAIVNNIPRIDAEYLPPFFRGLALFLIILSAAVIGASVREWFVLGEKERAKES